MSDIKKDQDLVKAPEANPIEAESVLKDLDKALAESDPEFVKKMTELSSIISEADGIDLMDIDKIIAQNENQSLSAKIERFKSSISRLIFRLINFFKYAAITFIKETLPKVFIVLKNWFFVGKDKLLAGVKSFKALSRKQKLAALVLIVGLSGLLIYTKAAITKGIIGQEKKLFIESMEELSSNKYFYKSDLMEDFYNSPRLNQNLVSLRRMVVNLRKSRNSSSNPMGAFEFFLQGNSSDVMIEIKDREAEVLDLFQLEIRGFDYDHLESSQGKQKLAEKLKAQINQILIKGKVNQIYFKTVILKP